MKLLIWILDSTVKASQIWCGFVLFCFVFPFYNSFDKTIRKKNHTK